jgi:phosphoglycolate phosphatase-like HAD superfamily hydrolase
LTDSYKTIILDVDGVIFDSNGIKEKNIFKAALTYIEIQTAKKFTAYFTRLNGVPRETKIFSYFSKDPAVARSILDLYNMLNNQSLYSVVLTKGALQFIQYCYDKFYIIALSGGAESEVKKLMRIHHISQYFKGIFGGPLTKEQNLKNIRLENPVLYIGDSKVDYEIANKISADFIFMYGYTQFRNWKDFFCKRKQKSIENLEELYDICGETVNTKFIDSKTKNC